MDLGRDRKFLVFGRTRRASRDAAKTGLVETEAAAGDSVTAESEEVSTLLKSFFVHGVYIKQLQLY